MSRRDYGTGTLTVAITVTVSITHDVDPEVLANRLFHFLAFDEDDLFPEIETIEGYAVVTESDTGS